MPTTTTDNELSGIFDDTFAGESSGIFSGTASSLNCILSESAHVSKIFRHRRRTLTRANLLYEDIKSFCLFLKHNASILINEGIMNKITTSKVLNTLLETNKVSTPSTNEYSNDLKEINNMMNDSFLNFTEPLEVPNRRRYFSNPNNYTIQSLTLKSEIDETDKIRKDSLQNNSLNEKKNKMHCSDSTPFNIRASMFKYDKIKDQREKRSPQLKYTKNELKLIESSLSRSLQDLSKHFIEKQDRYQKIARSKADLALFSLENDANFHRSVSDLMMEKLNDLKKNGKLTLLF
jgi:hypothetical protein